MMTGCSREPRSVSYFEAHPADAKQVAADCKAGAHRGRECDNALAGIAAADDAARLEMYRKTF
jgi:hypothetical protein